jgi:hypothetical protein
MKQALAHLICIRQIRRARPGFDPSQLILEYLFGQNDSKKISLLLVAAAVLAARGRDAGLHLGKLASWSP